ncbi:conserved Plasmodium protein, unknown function [Plasmodium gallinaceum]|uniref:Uncharacterized protein n=1 Tax=Plasmodium gallinaceum TaxID=5849 RepID=A0A1J1GXY6_PLAGA|nr:conserved Plasmodium protein, unknown function [Plasmodium gallinaceum]CRG97325.1 conserved Plasmodium protein, unknown function [Plasmodium gallinaceum]
MNEEKKNEKFIVKESIIYIKKYFALHDKTCASINELINIILNKNFNSNKGINEKETLTIIFKKELKYEFIKVYEILKITLEEMKKCIKKMKNFKNIIEESKTNSIILHSLHKFLKNTLIYFKRDYKLKENLHKAIIYVDETCENEINRIQLIWKETPFLFLIFQKFNTNKLIKDCELFLNKT